MRHGYTLIEIMVVIAVIAILFTIGYNSFQSYSREQALLSGVRMVQSDLSSAREAAIAGNKLGCGANLLSGYQFNVTSATTYTITPLCTGGTVDSNTLPSGITMSTPSPNPITFKALAQGTNISGTATITITQTITGNTRTITIGADGYVQ